MNNETVSTCPILVTLFVSPKPTRYRASPAKKIFPLLVFLLICIVAVPASCLGQGLYIATALPTKGICCFQVANGIDLFTFIELAPGPPGYVVRHSQNVDDGRGTNGSAKVTLDFPENNGEIGTVEFRKGSEPSWNSRVIDFETRARKAWATGVLQTDYYRLPKLKRDLTNYLNDQAKEERLVDRANAAYELARKMDTAADADTNISEAQTQVSDRSADQATDNLRSAMENWTNITAWVRLDASSIAQIQQTFPQLKSLGVESFNKRIDSLAALIPKPLAQPASKSIEVIIDSAAARQYISGNPPWPTLTVMFTAMKGQLLSIEGQTFNDFIVRSADGSVGLISKADVRLLDNTVAKRKVVNAQ